MDESNTVNMTDNLKWSLHNNKNLPNDIIVAYTELIQLSDRKEQRALERKFGRELVKILAAENFGCKEIVITGNENQKPHGICDNMEFHLSITHSNVLIFAAISKKTNLGIDIEYESRKISDQLIDRIRHKNDETDGMIPIRIWTMKEAALKWHGSGLRKPMNKLCLREWKNNRFRTDFDDGKSAEICSFEHNKYWVSIAYDPN